jgi:plasmid stabilization system protein ParE
VKALKRIVPRELANRDIEEAIEHYLVEASAKVAMGFVDELEKAYAHITRRPASGSPRYAHQLGSPICVFGRWRAAHILSSTSRVTSTSTSGACFTNSVISRRG